ncbi:hypothetical protein I6A60_12795 [Frankia sp. AgB1.9]|uniref:hypothetical protein n=1 Tax=unclassified Frankia TaxID=2632575 RepID=UPI00193285A6|nr:MULTISPECIES: hypothetical protein [unclassified Frankia]MBL7486548.1 hypothetical protein [Frankia sp. AgW1.1]MBL7548747.1 hypothetical protein [Frankia sp. AgB1.9]MBL7623921.1 hypothetical protein [Frankia sp. AgB1.8]
MAISVSQERLAERDDTQVHRVRASAALTAFTNALAVSLFALIPGHKIGPTSLAVGCVGLTFILASLLTLVRGRRPRWRDARDVTFLVGLATVFVVQLVTGAQIIAHPDQPGNAGTIAVLVVVCFLIGVARAWELIGGPDIGLGHAIGTFARRSDQRTSGTDGT